MAFIAPLFATFILGMTEMVSMEVAKKAVGAAAARGCRFATDPVITSNSSITTVVNKVLTDNKISTGAATITIKVNDVVTPVTSATKLNDKISITVSVPFSAVTWISSYMFLSSTSPIAETVVMMRQG